MSVDEKLSSTKHTDLLRFTKRGRKTGLSINRYLQYDAATKSLVQYKSGNHGLLKRSSTTIPVSSLSTTDLVEVDGEEGTLKLSLQSPARKLLVHGPVPKLQLLLKQIKHVEDAQPDMKNPSEPEAEVGSAVSPQEEPVVTYDLMVHGEHHIVTIDTHKHHEVDNSSEPRSPVEVVLGSVVHCSTRTSPEVSLSLHNSPYQASPHREQAQTVVSNIMDSVLSKRLSMDAIPQPVEAVGHADHVVEAMAAQVMAIAEEADNTSAAVAAAVESSPAEAHPAPTETSPADTTRQAEFSWIPDDAVVACQCCSKKFTVFFRRHHCRSCGHVVCGSCSDQKVSLPERGIQEEVRVCVTCYGAKKPSAPLPAA
eukprot:GILJ01001672.1.p1 GENE.GILJ01001672.1~~GILJ01001672.1.p1  ORF type:complete len:367 (-),score=52.70 GILJ01001672.1:194-1294(-)